MSTLESAPLIEAIFELKWGEVEPGKFNYTQEEQQLLVGKLSMAAKEQSYAIVKYLDSPKVPLVVTHRFLRDENTWPCLQLGLGIFTVNQVNEGYEWDTFKSTILEALEVFNSAHETQMEGFKRTALIGLRYQDAFYPAEGESIEEYLREYFNVQIELPSSFLGDDNISDLINSINTNFNLKTINPRGNIKVMITNAVIEGRPGLLMDTVVESKLEDVISGENDIGDIQEWLGKAHNLQKHTFDTLINASVYKG